MTNQDYWIFDENPETNNKYGCHPNDRTITELLDSGVVLINKPAGPTSHQLTAWARNLLGLNRLGHGGTLDPLASGVLPIAIGEATKVVSFIQNKIKKYSFIIKWGETTETDDKEGKVTETSSSRPNFNQIQKVLKNFIGKVNQKPPIYSAIKINGQRSYKLARKNLDINTPWEKIFRFNRPFYRSKF